MKKIAYFTYFMLAGISLGPHLVVPFACAKPVSPTGSLEFLGYDSTQTMSIWLSTTSSGAFQLESASQTRVVDQWSRDNDGSHVSHSPNVSSGSGGTHKLYDVTDGSHKLLDTQNQKGGVDVPDLIQPPATRPVPPIQILPPGGVTPERPIKPSHPIGTLPPGGVTPERPVKPSHPIGTLPPGGVTPEKPVKPSHPIGTLPPSGITPELPSRPSGPIGSLPSAPAPPVGTLPPSGPMPGVPSKPSPPIGSLPSAPAPPVGTLPPTGITPEVPSRPSGPTGPLPGAPAPPIGTLPPEGLTPGLPAVPGSPDVSPPGNQTSTADKQSSAQGADSRALHSGSQKNLEDLDVGEIVCPKAINEQTYQELINDRRYAHCFADYERDSGSPSQAPVTRGRRYDASAQWNIWVNPKSTKTIDQRYGRDLESKGFSVDFGADRHFGDGWLAGAWGSLMDNESSRFHSLVESDTDGFKIGPYLGKSISENWALSAFFSYGRFENSSNLSILEGEYNSEEFSALLNANGFYALSEDRRTRIQPSLSISYTHTKNEAFDLKGDVLDRPLALEVEETEANNGVATASAEISRTFYPGKKAVERFPTIELFLELGVSYEYERPNDGKILTGDFTYKTPSAWSGLAKTGVRSRIADSTYIEARLGYLSFGQGSYDEWEGSLYLSYTF